MAKVTCTNATIQIGNSEPMAVREFSIESSANDQPAFSLADIKCYVEFTAEVTYYNPYVGISVNAMCGGWNAVQFDAIGTHGERLSSVTTSDITPEGIELAAELAVKAARAKGKGRF